MFFFFLFTILWEYSGCLVLMGLFLVVGGLRYDFTTFFYFFYFCFGFEESLVDFMTWVFVSVLDLDERFSCGMRRGVLMRLHSNL